MLNGLLTIHVQHTETITLSVTKTKKSPSNSKISHKNEISNYIHETLKIQVNSSYLINNNEHKHVLLSAYRASVSLVTAFFFFWIWADLWEGRIYNDMSA